MVEDLRVQLRRGSADVFEALLYRYYVDEDTYLRENPDRIAPLLAEDLPFVHKDSDRLL